MARPAHHAPLGLDEANEAFRALAAGGLARGLIVFG